MWFKFGQLLLELKAGNWLKAAKLAAEIIHDALDAFTPGATFAAQASLTNEELISALQTEYDATYDTATEAFGDRLKVLLPLLMEILKRYLGGFLG